MAPQRSPRWRLLGLPPGARSWAVAAGAQTCLARRQLSAQVDTRTGAHAGGAGAAQCQRVPAGELARQGGEERSPHRLAVVAPPAQGSRVTGRRAPGETLANLSLNVHY